MIRRTITDLTTRMREQAAGHGRNQDPALTALTRIRDTYLATPGPRPSAEVESFLAGERPLAAGRPDGSSSRTSRWCRAVAWLGGAALAWQVGLGSTAAFAVVTGVGIAGSLPAPAQKAFDAVLTTLTPFDRAPGHDGETHGPDGGDPRRKAPEPDKHGPAEELGHGGEAYEELRQPGSHLDPTGPAGGGGVSDDTEVPAPHGGGQPGTPPNPGGGTQPVQPPGSGGAEGPNAGGEVEAPQTPEEEDEPEEDEPEEDEPEDDEPENDEPEDDEPEDDEPEDDEPDEDEPDEDEPDEDELDELDELEKDHR